MAKRRSQSTGREGGRFIALPHSVLESRAYMNLSNHARALLLEFALQYRGDDNGRLLCSGKHLAARGWKSNDRITRAKRELLDAGFIHETVKGCRPNRASWYAVTWQTLDKLQGMDPEAVKTFERGAYRKINVLTPYVGVASASIAPYVGVGTHATTPTGGAIKGSFAHSSTPYLGDPLDMPSVGTKEMGAGARAQQGARAQIYSLPLIRRGKTETWAGASRLAGYCRPIARVMTLAA